VNDQAELTAVQVPKVPRARAPEDLEEPSFQAFFSAHYDRLARALFLLTGDGGEAEDLTQEAMVRVYERWVRVSRMASPEGYLYRTALNLHRSRLRRLVTRRKRAEPQPRAGADPADAAATGDAVARALAELPDGQREAVVLVSWLGLDAEEAGAMLGIEPVSVRARLSRARATLRKHLHDDLDDDGAPDA
jgi:RNA polymerase sigma-70 factor (ECF subfamily)